MPPSLALLLLGCASNTPTPEAAAAASTQPPVEAPAPVEDESAPFVRVAPRGDTICGDGSEYAFFVREADPEKLLVYLQGGGACWSGDTCSPHRFGASRTSIEGTDPSTEGGIFDLSNTANPFGDYSMLFIAYCTGDVHLGDTETDYRVEAAPEGMPLREGQDPGEHRVHVNHRGHTNGMAALEWARSNFANPETIFVVGSSAGAIAAPYYGAQLAAQYPDARLAVLGDGAGGYRVPPGGTPAPAWKTLQAISDHPAFAALTPEAFRYESLYMAAGVAYPEHRFAQVDSAEDHVQRYFLNMGGGPEQDLLPGLDANHADIQAATSNFRFYVAPGEAHTALGEDALYETTSADVSLVDWVHRLADGEEVEDVHCGERCSEADPAD